jgi:hypothetical protein
MAKSNLNQQAKRKRQLAKQDKRVAKDVKRQVRKAEARTTRTDVDGTSPAASKPPTQPNLTSLAAAAFIRRMRGSL